MHHHLITFLPLADMYLSFLTEEVGDHCTGKDHYQCGMHTYQSPLLVIEIVVAYKYDQEVKHEEQLQKEKKRRIVYQHLRCLRTHLLFDEGGCGQTCRINEQKQDSSPVGRDESDDFVHAVRLKRQK